MAIPFEITNKYIALFDESDVTHRGDMEGNHIRYDEILCELLTELGYRNLSERFGDSDKWYA